MLCRLGDWGRFAGVWLVVFMLQVCCPAGELSGMLVSEIRDGHQRLREAASITSGSIRRWRGVPQQGELSFASAGFSSNLNAVFYVRGLSRRLDYFGDEAATDLVSTILQTEDKAYRYVVSGGGTGSPLAALYSYDSLKHVDVSSAIATDLESGLFALYAIGGRPMLDYVQGAEISVETTDDRIELSGVHKVADSTITFTFLLDRSHDYAVVASTLNSESPGVVTNVQSVSELEDGIVSGFLLSQMATRVQISMNGVANPSLSYQEVTSIEYDKEQPAADIFSDDIFPAFGREFAVISVLGDDTHITAGGIVPPSGESPGAAAPVPNARSRNTYSLFLVVNGVLLLFAAVWLFFWYRRPTRRDSK